MTKKTSLFKEKFSYIYINMKKNTKSTFMKNVIFLMISQIIVKLFGLVYRLYLTNKAGFGDIGNAIFSSAFQVYALFLTISSIGIPNAIASLVSNRLSKGNSKEAYRIFKIALAIFGTIGFTIGLILYLLSHKICSTYLKMPETEEVLKILAPSIFMVSIEAVLKGYFNGREQIKNTANAVAIEQVAKSISTIIIVEIIAIISYNNTVLMCEAVAIATFLSNIISVTYLTIKYILGRKEIFIDLITSKEYKRERVKHIIKSIMQIAIPISLSAMLSMLTKAIDTFTIIRLGEKIIGMESIKLQYGILSGKIETLIALPYSFNIAFSTTLIPTISALKAKNNIKLIKKRIKGSLFATILMGLPITVVMSLFSKLILNILFPNASLGAELLKISSWNIIIVMLIQTISGSLQGLGDVKTPVVALLIGGVLKLILNILLIPIKKMVIKGAIISSIISQTITLLICAKSLINRLKPGFEERNINTNKYKKILKYS